MPDSLLFSLNSFLQYLKACLRLTIWFCLYLNMLKKFYFLLLLFPLLLTAQSKNDDDDYVNGNVLKYDDYVYKTNIKTVQFYESSWEYALPAIALNGSEQIQLSFDDLDSDQKQYSL